jgi:natural product precursor
MKKRNELKKLQLNKERIVSLSNSEMNRIQGGTSGTSSQRCIATMQSSNCQPQPPQPVSTGFCTSESGSFF